MATWGPYAIQAQANDGTGYGASGWIDNDCYCGRDDSNTYGAGFRWTNVTIPKNSTITSALITVRAYGVSGTLSNIHGRFYGELSGNAGAWGTGDLATQMTETTAYVAFEPSTTPGEWTTLTDYDDWDLKDIIQEIVNHADWVSGNALRIGLQNNASTGSGAQYVDILSYDRDATYCARITIEYTEPSASQFARPSSVVAAGNWDGFIGGVDQNDAANLDNYIDETSADDNDSIRSGTTPTDDTATIGLSAIDTPQAGTVTMRIRARFL